MWMCIAVCLVCSGACFGQPGHEREHLRPALEPWPAPPTDVAAPDVSDASVDVSPLCVAEGGACESSSECCGEFTRCESGVCQEILCAGEGEEPDPEGPGCCDGLQWRDGLCATPRCSLDGENCTDDAACCSRRCLLGECRVECASERDCDDLNPCTLDNCIFGDGVCRRDPLFGQLPDDRAGDCIVPFCDERQNDRGESVSAYTYREAVDDTPRDDGIECTEEICWNGIPYRFPNDSACGPMEEGWTCHPRLGCVRGEQP